MMPLDDAFSSVALAASRAELLKGVSRIAAAVGYDHVALAYRAPLKSAFGDAARGAGRAASAMDALVHEGCEHPSVGKIAKRCAPQSEFLEVPYMQRSFSGTVPTSMTTYPTAWLDECTRLPAAQIAVDPILKHLNTQVHSLVWGEATYASAKIAGVYEAFAAYGLGSGMTVSVRGPLGDTGCVGFTCAARKTLSTGALLTELGTLQLTASATYNALARIVAQRHRQAQRHPRAFNGRDTAHRCRRWNGRFPGHPALAQHCLAVPPRPR